MVSRYLDSLVFKKYILNYTPGTIQFFINEVTPNEAKMHIRALLNEDQKIPEVSTDRALAMAFLDLAKFIQENKINACFLNQRITDPIFYTVF